MPQHTASTHEDDGHLLLQQQQLRLIVDAAHGGAIRAFGWRGQPILRPTVSDAEVDPFAMGCFPMVPYANRIANGRFSFDARTVRLQRNWQQDPHPLHGQGWCRSWTIAHSENSSATLTFEGGGDEWPWRYRAEQQFRLGPTALTVRLSVENLAQSPMPAMLGIHPYFPDAASAELETTASRVWQTDQECLAVEDVAAPAAWSFEKPRLVAAVPLDHCFTEWDGTAVLRWPDRKLVMRAANCRFLHVYTPPGRDFFCLEPQNAAAGALNRGDAPVVAPNGRTEICVSFEIGPP